MRELVAFFVAMALAIVISIRYDLYFDGMLFVVVLVPVYIVVWIGAALLKKMVA
jgi:hypothetical protein